MEKIPPEQEKRSWKLQYTDLYNFSPVGYFTIDRKGTNLRVDLTGAGLVVEVERSYLVNGN